MIAQMGPPLAQSGVGAEAQHATKPNTGIAVAAALPKAVSALVLTQSKIADRLP